ncbi:FecCD family ABC transporter permease [Egicoccus halophilus]|uniref:FecCD family ABC transporter permease n=1 Tax=Egicoccus halophilus TaxID=1670830 RepID=UPI00197B027D|nr:iron ABC transporter permease [Egicoccus halophilus]
MVAVCLGLFVLAAVASLLLGVRGTPPIEVWRAFTDPVATSGDHRVVLDLRVPRTLVGALAGVALGLAGTLIQGVTRNPIADPGLLGINAGASLAVVLAIWLLGVTSPTSFVWFAFAGAALAALAVAAIGRGDPVRLALGGAALTALLTPVITMVLMRSRQAFDEYRFWAVGSLTGRDLDLAGDLWPYVATGAVLAVVCAHRLNLLALGDDVARGLGQRVGTTRALAGLGITLLAGAATSLVGPIALVGLVVPHAARRLAGSDYRRILPVAAVLGATLLLVADVIGRLVARPGELEAGIVTAFLGAPVLVAVARGRKVAQL